MTDLDKLQRVLAAEHAAVYAYGLIGARLSGSRRQQARAAFSAHRTRRDRLHAMIAEGGGTPVESSPSYRLPFPVSAPADAVRLAAHVEDRLSAAYLELVSARDPALRRLAALAMQECVTRGYSWRPAVPTALPGMPARPSPSAQSAQPARPQQDPSPAGDPASSDPSGPPPAN
ncbi:ferritin-like domain-containing protein [Bailinhaonella thermotolerans]|uniref:DUF4439 domain-containing protein n=1 Tax=Bailinhaonella thermotolerans TaxID=1070861 RepID=A0A3A4AIY7_9ACTN|nr:ferritin-like domain-containing protein [Bailinhaonella thermotolerans]RJL26577.1 DUF4439 domain-containing protein [Bailinhaonella thermotolerans]